MRASEALSYEPAACWRRLIESKEFFFEDLDEHMKEQHQRFLEGLMGYERQCFLNAQPYERSQSRADQANGFYPRAMTTRRSPVWKGIWKNYWPSLSVRQCIWKRLRTPNVIERLFVEVRRRIRTAGQWILGIGWFGREDLGAWQSVIVVVCIYASGDSQLPKIVNTDRVACLGLRPRHGG